MIFFKILFIYVQLRLKLMKKIRDLIETSTFLYKFCKNERENMLIDIFFLSIFNFQFILIILKAISNSQTFQLFFDS
jgi:hypothetical protein